MTRRISQVGTLSRRVMLKNAGLAVGAVGAAGLVAACAPAAAPPTPAVVASRGGTLVYATGAEVASLDPAYGTDSTTEAAFRLLYDGLVRFNADLEVEPRLATSWSASGNTWTFKLRAGVKFHDGTPFDAAAVVARFDRVLGPEKPLIAAVWASALAGVPEALDPLTVRFTTKVLDPYFPLILADYQGYIESPTAVKKFGKGLASNPVGTGPFKFVEWIKDDHLTVVRNDDFWGDKAFLDKVILRPVPVAAARLIGVEAGDVQLAIRVAPEDVARAEKNPELRMSQKPTTRHLFIGMLNLKKPYSDIRVRQALNYAIDKESIVKNIYLGQAEVLGGPVVPGCADYVPVKGFGYDPAKAKQLLAEAGYPNGFSANMIGPKGTYLKDYELQLAVIQQYRAIGVNVTLETVEYTTYLDRLFRDPNTSTLEMWQDARGTLNGAGRFLLRTYGCNFFRPDKGSNVAGTCNPRVDELATEGASTVDPVKRLVILKQAQELMTEHAPSAFILATKETAVMTRRLHDPVHLRNSTLTVDEHTWLELR